MEGAHNDHRADRESGDDDDDVNGFFFQFEHKRSDRRLREEARKGGRGPFISQRWMKRKENRELGTKEGKRPKSQISGPHFLHGLPPSCKITP